MVIFRGARLASIVNLEVGEFMMTMPRALVQSALPAAHVLHTGPDTYVRV